MTITDKAGMPHNKGAERAVLSQCFHSADHLERIMDAGITRLDFHTKDHRVVFDAVTGLCRDGDIVDQVTVSDRLERDGKLKDGMLVLVAQLAGDTSPRFPRYPHRDTEARKRENGFCLRQWRCARLALIRWTTI